MNFTEIVADILATTKRPDKLPLIRREVNSAIVIFSQSGDWQRTFVEVSVAINPAEYTQAIAMTEVPRHRKFSYIRRGGTQKYLTRLELTQLGSPSCDLRDKYYVAGESLNISMVTVAPTLDIGYYAYPALLTDASPEYWLLEGAWPAVFNRATSKVFDDIGDTTSSVRYERQAVAAWLEYKNNKHNGE